MTDESRLRAIHQVVAEVERAQQNADPEAFLRLFTPEAVWVTAFGRRLVGLPAIAEFTRQVLPASASGPTARYTVANVVFLRPDVAAVQVDQQPITRDGRPFEGEEPGRPLYVMVEEGGSWRIAAGQNTKVRADASPPRDDLASDG